MTGRLCLPRLSSSQLELWTSVEAKPESVLIRLSVLRDFSRTIHAELSVVLATPAATQSSLADLDALDRHIAQGLHLRTLPLDAEAWLKGKVLGPVATVRRKIFPEFFEVLARDRIERYDRAWEREIVAEAIAIGWEIRSIEAWVDVLDAQGWETRFSQRIRAHGVVLFAESAYVDDARWKGRWIFVVKPGFELGSWAECEEESKLLFPKSAPLS